MQRGKIRSIQFPAIRYFTYYVARGVVARDNTSNITNLHLAILAAAINKDRTFSIGALIARRLATNHGRGAIYGGVIASCLRAARVK